jgi:tetratricopeptide (TPR) repeat protein
MLTSFTIILNILFGTYVPNIITVNGVFFNLCYSKKWRFYRQFKGYTALHQFFFRYGGAEINVYRYRAEPEKDLRPAQLPYTEIYLLYGSLLVEMKRYAEAQEALRKGLRWNPVSFNMTSEYIETYKVTGDLEKFFSLTKEAFKIAFRSSDVARCYRNLGYFFVEKKLWSEATACYLLSLQYDHDSKTAQSELYFINSSAEGKIQEPSIDQAREYREKYGFPIGADEDVIGLAVSYGKHFLEQGALNAAKYFLSIAYDLTGSDDILKIIEQLPKDTKE